MPRTQAAQQDKKAKKAVMPAPAPKATSSSSRASSRPPRSTRGDRDAEARVRQRPRDLRSTGDARDSLDDAKLEVVGSPVSKEHLENLKFMEETIVVVVHESTNPLDEPIPEVWNGGIRQAFIRGQKQTVKRKFVEVLARAKKTSYTQEELPARGGYRNVPHTALRYPFSILEDKNPRGAAWLDSLMQQG